MDTLSTASSRRWKTNFTILLLASIAFIFFLLCKSLLSPPHQVIIFGGNEELKKLSVEEVGDFYNKAWDKLIYTAGIFGVALPILLNWYQTQSFKKEMAETKKRFQRQVNKLSDEYKKENIKIQVDFKDKLEEQHARTTTTLNDELAKANKKITDTTASHDANTQIVANRINLISLLQAFSARSNGQLAQVIIEYVENLDSSVQSLADNRSKQAKANAEFKLLVKINNNVSNIINDLTTKNPNQIPTTYINLLYQRIDSIQATIKEGDTENFTRWIEYTTQVIRSIATLLNKHPNHKATAIALIELAANLNNTLPSKYFVTDLKDVIDEIKKP
jgi:type II secretory pathway pseudopilin PulG